MLKTFMEGMKSNKGSIIKKTLIVGGTIAGLVLVGKLLQPKEDEESEDQVDLEPENGNEETTNEPEQENE